MKLMEIQYDLVDKLLEYYYEEELGQFPSDTFTVIREYLKTIPQGEKYDEYLIDLQYGNLLMDKKLVVEKDHPLGHMYKGLSAKGREVYENGGYAKHLAKIQKAELEAKAKSDEQHTALVNSAKSAQSASAASWISGIASLLAFGFSIYQSIESNKLETKVAVLESQIQQLTAQHNAFAAKGLVLPLPRLDSAVVKRKN